MQYDTKLMTTIRYADMFQKPAQRGAQMHFLFQKGN